MSLCDIKGIIMQLKRCFVDLSHKPRRHFSMSPVASADTSNLCGNIQILPRGGGGVVILFGIGLLPWSCEGTFRLFAEPTSVSNHKLRRCLHRGGTTGVFQQHGSVRHSDIEASKHPPIS